MATLIPTGRDGTTGEPRQAKATDILEGEGGATLSVGGQPAAHAIAHVGGGDAIQLATSGQDGLATAAQITKLDGIETAADVTDAINVNAAGAVMEADYDANTILAATSDDTPVALTVAEQRIVGRITAGAITGLTAAEIRTLINVADGAEVNPALISQAEAEAGTATTERIFSALRVAQAIAALGGGGGGGGVPNVTNWAKNTETLAGTKTLTDASQTVQFLDPDGADRAVKLPVLTASTPFFMIVNTGATGGINIQNALGQSVESISPGGAIRIWTDGVNAYKHAFSVAIVTNTQGKLAYPFGASMAVANNFFVANGEINTTREGTYVAYKVAHTVSVAGTADLVTFKRANFNAVVFELWKNGALDTAFASNTDINGSLVPSTSVAAGDALAFKDLTGVPGQTTLEIYVTPTTGQITALAWGGSVTSSNRYLKALGVHNATVNSTRNQDTTFVLAESVDAGVLAWITQSSMTTTTFDIYKNGASSETVLPTGTSGVSSALSTTFAAGDTTSLLRVGGSGNPQQSVWTMSLVRSSGSFLFFGGDASTSVSQFYRPHVLSSVSGFASFSLASTTTPAGTFDSIGVRRQTSGTLDTYEVWKNGAASTSASSGTSNAELVSFAATAFTDDDEIAIKDISSFNSGDSTISTLFKVA